MNFKEVFTTNSWWGKILGAVFGFLASGSPGAVFGVIIGNLFDRGLSHYFTKPLYLYFSEKSSSVRKLFFEATFSIMGYLAKIDGQVTEQELHMARSVMNEMNLSKEQKIVAMRLFNEGKNSQFNLNPVLDELHKACKDNRDLLKVFMDIQYQAARTDGLTAAKIKALDHIFTKLGFLPFHTQYRFYEDFGTTYSHDTQDHKEHQSNSSSSSSGSYSSYSRQNYKPTKSNLDHAYALMQVSPGASKQDVKRAYRRLLSKNHPDKLIAQGLSQEMIKIANEKTQKIVKAYELICESKGW